MIIGEDSVLKGKDLNVTGKRQTLYVKCRTENNYPFTHKTKVQG